nr:BBP7 family outer membrane beta-barrel protein [Planctomycetota bacterium]
AFWLGEWDDSSRQTGAFGFSPPAGGVSSIAPATLTSEAELWGGDLMWWNQMGCGTCSRWALGIGARLIRFDEVARVDDWQPNTGAATARVEADVENQFVGIQAGVLYERDISSRLMVELTARGFIGKTRMEIDVSDVNVLSAGPHSARLGETEDTFGFDLGVQGRYQLGRNVAVTASYGLLFLADVQRAPDAMDFAQAGTGVVQARKDTDSLLAHSFFIGIQLDL